MVDWPTHFGNFHSFRQPYPAEKTKPLKAAQLIKMPISHFAVAMKLFLILCWAALATCTYPPPKSWGKQPAPVPCAKQSIELVRKNADNLLYLEYMRKQAQGDEDFLSWTGTDEYQQRLNEFQYGNCETESSVICPSAPSCEYNCGSSCENYGPKIAMLQAELKRQRLMIQRLYAQILVISQTKSSSCDCK
jgi:hypothetical protein